MEVVGIVIAVIAALFVLFHARIRQLPLWMAASWALATFLLFVVMLPIYLLVHGPEPKRQNGDS